MRKIACFLLAVLMAAAFAVPAMAADVSASYDHGKLTVSTTADNWFRINVDGVGTGRSLTPKVPTLTMDYELSDGEHKISISSDIVGGGSVTIKVVDGVSVNGGGEGESAAPVKPAEHTEHTPVEIPAKAPTCTETGLTAGEKCSEGGEILKAQETIPALGHRYAVASKNGDTISYQCMRCDKVIKARAGDTVQNRLGNIITDAEGKPVNYQAGKDRADEKLLVLKVEKPSGEATLNLEIGLIMQLFREGFSSVEFINGKADLVIPMSSISNSWFTADTAVSGYLFTTNPASDGEMTLLVKAQTENGIVEATQDTGLALK